MWTVPIKNPNADGVKIIVKRKALVGYDFVRLKASFRSSGFGLPCFHPLFRSISRISAFILRPCVPLLDVFPVHSMSASSSRVEGPLLVKGAPSFLASRENTLKSSPFASLSPNNRLS